MRDLVIERDVDAYLHRMLDAEDLAAFRCAICRCVNNLLSWSVVGRRGRLVTCSSHYCRAKAQQFLDSEPS